MSNYETSDVYLAAYLRLTGSHYIGHRRQGSKMLFSFRDYGEIKDKAWNYVGGNATCCPKKLRDSVRDLKTMVKLISKELV